VTVFANRVDAGKQLGERLDHLRGRNVVVLGLPRGGVPVAAEIAKTLDAPLDVIVVRKLGVPYQPEVAMGAIGEGGLRVLDERIVAHAGVSGAQVSAVESRERGELDARVQRLRSGRTRIDLTGRVVVVVDDGIATGATARVACQVARSLGAGEVILAVPVGPADVAKRFTEANEVICLWAPRDFRAVGQFYEEFGPTSDEEVVSLLDEAEQRMRRRVQGGATEPVAHSAEDEIKAQGTTLATPEDLDGLVQRLGVRDLVCIGEASHGTHEYYWWRAELSKRLIVEKGFTWIGVEGDWPDCWRIDRWVRGVDNQELDAWGLLRGFERWPTWMWANEDVAEFLNWLRALNLSRPAGERVGFYGLDVYSLWDSLRIVIDWLTENAPDAMDNAHQAWRCFDLYAEDPQRYAWATRLVPRSCENDVVSLLVEVRQRALATPEGNESAFNALQNAEVAAGAERYYRTMVQGDRESWNVRDTHMADTVDRLGAHLGPSSKALIWEHNTHVGDARGTDMARAGMVNVGQLLRERYGSKRVALVGMASFAGTVIAAHAWGETEQTMEVPCAMVGSHEELLHRSLQRSAVLDFTNERSGPWLGVRRGHRAIGVVYDPARESNNYVPTVMGARYDALLWFERSSALVPLHHERAPDEPEYETSPTGY
jgi:erythromycin esterase